MLETALVATPKLYNPEGVISALVTQEFGIMYLKPEEPAERTPEQQHQIWHLAHAAVFSSEATQAALETPGVPVFVDLRAKYTDSKEDSWAKTVYNFVAPSWSREKAAYLELFTDLIDNTDLGESEVNLLTLRGLYAAAELKMASHMKRQPSESTYVGFDSSAWPYRLFCVSMSQLFDPHHYISKVSKLNNGKGFAWQNYEQLFPREWDDDEALMFSLAEIPEAARQQFISNSEAMK